jgi:hypothetical protein
MSDYSVINLPWLLQSNPDGAFHERYRAKARALAEFLTRNSLSTVNLIAEYDVAGDKFDLPRSKVTEEGFTVLQLGLERWMKATSMSEPPYRMNALVKALKKVRS